MISDEELLARIAKHSDDKMSAAKEEIKQLRARVAELERENAQALATLVELAPVKARDDDKLSASEFGPISKADYDSMAFIGGGGIKSKDASVTLDDEDADTISLPSFAKVVGEYVGVPKARYDAERAVIEAAKALREAESASPYLGDTPAASTVGETNGA
jgi:hypothetical protein